MHYTSNILGALALTSLAAAVPVDKRSWGWGSSAAPAPTSAWSAPPAAGTSYAPPPPSGSSGPVVFPLANGFPNIQNPSSQLTGIEQQAHGTLPNGPPPPSLAAGDLTSLRLIAFNEIFEVFYFSELLNNVTSNAAGYQFQDQAQRQQVIEALTAVVAQEELHALNANGALAHFNAGPIQACKYQAPVSDFKSAITLAYTFTDVVLGTLGDAATAAAVNGDPGLIAGFAAVIGQEGEQNGFYRSMLGKIPSALPFLTASSPAFAFSALNQNFVINGTCPNINTIDIPILGLLSIPTPPTTPTDQTLQFSVAGSSSSELDGYSVVYINQQNLPIVEAISNAQASNGVVSFSANFPGATNEMNGLTIASVTKGSGPFASADDVAKAAVFGPGLIEIN